MSNQKQFWFQIQFERKETQSEREAVVKDMVQIIENCGVEVKQIWIDQSAARSYKNINAVVEKPYAFWSSLKSLMKKSSRTPKKMVVTCEGDRGWDDYLLLHHFDKAQKLDDVIQG
jgi:hypothetical protein